MGGTTAGVGGRRIELEPRLLPEDRRWYLIPVALLLTVILVVSGAEAGASGAVPCDPAVATCD